MRFTLLVYFVQICAILQFSFGAPARTPELLLKDDLNDLKSSIKQLSEKMENLNFLYLNNLEPKVALTSTSLTSIDTNLRNIQERAHVWDTFQLYIASWNEQMSTTDRKLDIISKGQEKLFTLDAKVNSIVGLGLEYKIDSVFKRLTHIEENLGTINTNINQSPRDTLFAEFAAKGILSVVKNIEKKLEDNTTTNCNSSQDMLSDVSAKVDIIYDRVSSKEDVDESEDDDFEGSGEELIITKKKRNSCKAINTQLREIKNAINNTETNTIQMLEVQETLKRKVIENPTVDIESYFAEQRAHFDGIIKKHSCVDNSVKTETTPASPTHSPKNQPKLGCSDLYARETGIYYSEGVPIYCIKNDHTWTVIQRRMENMPYENFSLSWIQYKAGFGNVDREFWAGNEFIHSLTDDGGMVLRIELEDFKGNFAWAEYETFRIGSEIENYILNIGGFSGNASDALSSHNNSMFSTFDKKNDKAPACCPCAVSYGGGWWYNSCFEANLNGIYLEKPQSNGYYEGIIWEPWLGNYSLKRTTMMIRKKIVHENRKQSNGVGNDEIPFYEDP